MTKDEALRAIKTLRDQINANGIDPVTGKCWVNNVVDALDRASDIIEFPKEVKTGAMDLETLLNSPQWKVRQKIVEVINAVIAEEKGNGELGNALKTSKELNPLIADLIAKVPPEEAARTIAACIHDSMQVVCRIGFAA